MGAAKAALEVLCRYFAVALAPRQITENAVSPGWTDDSVLNSLPQAVQDMVRNWQQAGVDSHAPARPARGHWKCRHAALLRRNELDHGQTLDVDGGASLVEGHLPLEIQQIPAAQAHAA